MPYYPMRCTFSSCGLEFDHFTKPDLYDLSKKDSFRDVRCSYCGSFGTAERCYPRDSAPANLTVKGTWGKHASPGLKGQDFYTKQERDRQLASVGRTSFDDGDNPHPKKSSSATKTFKVGKDGKLFQDKKPSDLLREYAEENDGLVDFAGLVEKTGLPKRKLQGAVMGAIRGGWLEKAEVERTYRLL